MVKTSAAGLRLLFSGDTVLVAFSVALFFASLANATQWPALRAFRYCGICTLLLSLTFLLLSSRELFKEQRRKRTMVAVAFFLAAPVICLRGVHVVVTQ